MKNKTTLSKEDILHIAKLANLPIQDEEIDRLQSQLSETISYIKNLSELDTTKVNTTSHTTVLPNEYFVDGQNNERKLDKSDVLANAEEHTKDFFVVKRIMHDE